MSALPPIADIRQRIEHVCFVPKADIEGVDSQRRLPSVMHTKNTVWQITQCRSERRARVFQAQDGLEQPRETPLCS